MVKLYEVIFAVNRMMEEKLEGVVWEAITTVLSSAEHLTEWNQHFNIFIYSFNVSGRQRENVRMKKIFIY